VPHNSRSSGSGVGGIADSPLEIKPRSLSRRPAAREIVEYVLSSACRLGVHDPRLAPQAHVALRQQSRAFQSALDEPAKHDREHPTRDEEAAMLRIDPALTIAGETASPCGVPAVAVNSRS
jgi:hypothetical protein